MISILSHEVGGKLDSTVGDATYRWILALRSQPRYRSITGIWRARGSRRLLSLRADVFHRQIPAAISYQSPQSHLILIAWLRRLTAAVIEYVIQYSSD